MQLSFSSQKLKSLIQVIWLYTKYQLISKLILAFVVFPIFQWFTHVLLKFSGKTNLSSGDYISFLFSTNGIIFLLIAFVIVVITIGVDTNALIVLSALIQEKRLKLTLKEVFITSLKSLKYFFSFAGVILVIYIGILLPLISIGVSLTPFRNFAIPSFITEVIFNTPIYKALYIVSIVALTIISFIYIFTLHYIIITRKPILTSLKLSQQLICTHWKKFIVDYIGTMLKIFLAYALILLVIMGLAFIIGGLFEEGHISRRAWLIFIILNVAEIIGYFIFLQIPISIQIVTKLFYKYNQDNNIKIQFNLDAKTNQEQPALNQQTNQSNQTNQVAQENKASQANQSDKNLNHKISKSGFSKLIIQIGVFLGIIFTANTTIAYLAANNFNELFIPKSYPQIVAHRAGGELGAENTVQGLEQSIKHHVNWAEFDVQRTKDGYYIINHDKTFKRLSNVNQTPQQLTLSQIQQLTVRNTVDPQDPAQPVATLEQFLDIAKDKIGLFLELKGVSADPQMVKDVVAMVKAKHMLNQVVFLSLDYSLIQYMTNNYPEIKTGYLYFFNAGDLKNLDGNYLVMEEREATEDNIDYIHQIGKKAVVWTVNSEESINHFIYSGVDAIITDNVLAVQKAIAKAKKRTDLEMIIDSFIE